MSRMELRGVLLSLCLMASAACGHTGGIESGTSAALSDEGTENEFISVEGGEFVLEGSPYNFVGVNFWYGAYLGAGDGIGDIERLRAELDLLKSLGVTNLRILGASESSPMRDSVSPAFSDRNGNYNETLLKGLDVLLTELQARDMHAVIYLNNFWEWSGGMATYLSWVNGGVIVDPSDPEFPWPLYPIFTKQFYSNDAAQELFEDYLEAVVTRTNSITGVPYRDDPTIMAWQLANEPRPGNIEVFGQADLPSFQKWIDDTAGLIKSLDPNHLVSTGNEGYMGCAEFDPCFVDAHDGENIDYLTIHIWPFNWGWFDRGNMAGTIDSSLARATAYIEKHNRVAKAMNKPLVIEEFGLPRDAGAIAPGSPTTYRDKFLSLVYDAVETDVSTSGPISGTNVWSWGGYGRAQHEDGVWQDGDKSYTGDPPQEAQGLNSIFDEDDETLLLMRQHADRLLELSE